MMTQKKEQTNEQNNEKGYVSDSFLNTLWGQYEAAQNSTRQFNENQREAFIRTLKEASVFNSEFRNALISFYEQTKTANTKIINQLQPKSVGAENSEAKEVIKNQLQDVSIRLENLMLTPVKASFNIMDRLEKRAIENSQAILEQQQKRTEELAVSTDKYIKLAWETNKKVAHRVEDSFKVLVGTEAN